MRRRRFLGGVAIALALVLPDATRAQDDLIEEASPLHVTIGRRVVRLETLTVKRAGTAGRLPIALIAHGKPTTQGRMSDRHADEYLPQARDLARRGWLAVVVMRRGFGNSDGPQPVPLSCASGSLVERFDADADDMQATLATVAQRPDADATRVIAIGVSAGGAAVMSLSARNPPGLRAAINVSGGLRFNSCPKEDLLVAAFGDYGARSRVPSLWIYAENDSYFGPDLVHRMRAAFREAGGDSKLVMFEAESYDGHQLFGNGRGRMKWLPELDGFLRYLKLPTWTQQDVTALMQKAGAKETSRGTVERYLAAPSEKALTRVRGGGSLAHAYGWRSMEDARRQALEYCKRAKAACEVIMENGRWVGPVM
jgi:dienelactone hydrolase